MKYFLQHQRPQIIAGGLIALYFIIRILINI